MAQSVPGAPSVVMSHAGVRQQVPLRDYLNARIAPFLKRAMTQSLDVEAEFPLQWLGECLINQSVLYEGNPDPTNIRERFRYNFDTPTVAPTETQPKTEPQTEPIMNGTLAETVPEATAPEATAPEDNIERQQSRSDRGVERMEEDENNEHVADVPVPEQDTEMADTT